MSNPFLAEIRAFGFNFAPFNWLQCNGQLLPVSQYAALFSLLGTNFGGNGTSNFGLPNLQGDVPMHWGSGAGLSTYVLGQPAGSSNVTLLITQLPNHRHNVQVAEGAAHTTEPTGTPGTSTWLGLSDQAKAYATSGTLNTTLAQNAIGLTGNSQPHENMQPYLTVNFCIATSGVFPTRS